MLYALNTFGIKCDGCSKELRRENGLTIESHSRPWVMESFATDRGWTVTQDEKHYCPECSLRRDTGDVIYLPPDELVKFEWERQPKD